MGQRDHYTPGTFSWTDLTTPDQEAAKHFYGTLFDWEATDVPVGEGGTYTMMSIGGANVAAVSPQPEQQRQAGAPPLWNSYITVEDADRALERAGELGATVHAPAFDVMDAGRMGVVQDPQGAFFLVWQPNTNIGAGLVNARGALSWNELATPDLAASAAFYSQMFGWTTEPFDMPGMSYLVVKAADGHTNGGIRPMMAQERPYWLVYFGSDDTDADYARVSELGGMGLAEPVDIGVGKLAVVRDPEGAVFALYGGHFEP